jgi:hypothetical protein
MQNKNSISRFLRRRWVKRTLIFLGVIFFLLGIFYFAGPNEKNIGWGVNYSPDFAAYLGFDKKELFTQILEDLKPKYVRLMAYWEDLEANRGKFDIGSTDFIYMLNSAQERNVKVILVLGRKQPRWPECHNPSWYENLPQNEKDEAVLNMLKEAVFKFKDFKSVEMWQIENEPYFNYGPNCPPVSKEMLQKELEVVRSLDSRPIVLTDSGEKGAWLPLAWSGGDIFGTTLYRQVYEDKKMKYMTYPVPPMFYKIRAGMNRLLSPVGKIIGVELQAEPWFSTGLFETPFEKQNELMNPGIFYANIKYASQTGLPREYFWGVEWWYWLKAKGHSGMFEAAKHFFNNIGESNQNKI